MSHSPDAPSSGTPATISAKVTDPDGVASVELLYQVVAPGAFIPAFLPAPFATLTNNPNAPQRPDPAFEEPADWTRLPMVDGGGGSYSAQIPAQPHRTLVRYRIAAADALAAAVRVPYPDDGSLNFA